MLLRKAVRAWHTTNTRSTSTLSEMLATMSDFNRHASATDCGIGVFLFPFDIAAFDIYHGFYFGFLGFPQTVFIGPSALLVWIYVTIASGVLCNR